MRPFELTFQQGELILDLREIQIVDYQMILRRYSCKQARKLMNVE